MSLREYNEEHEDDENEEDENEEDEEVEDDFTPRPIYRYHEMYSRDELDERAIKAVAKAVKDGIWRASMEDQLRMYNQLASDLCDIYGLVSKPTVVKGDAEIYFGAIMTIGLPAARRSNNVRFSLVSFLHEFEHHCQNVGKQVKYGDDKETDARAWSISMFRYACPVSFENAWKNRTIMYMPPYNDTYDETVIHPNTL